MFRWNGESEDVLRRKDFETGTISIRGRGKDCRRALVQWWQIRVEDGKCKGYWKSVLVIAIMYLTLVYSIPLCLPACHPVTLLVAQYCAIIMAAGGSSNSNWNCSAHLIKTVDGQKPKNQGCANISCSLASLRLASDAHPVQGPLHRSVLFCQEKKAH